MSRHATLKNDLSVQPFSSRSKNTSGRFHQLRGCGHFVRYTPADCLSSCTCLRTNSQPLKQSNKQASKQTDIQLNHPSQAIKTVSANLHKYTPELACIHTSMHASMHASFMHARVLAVSRDSSQYQPLCSGIQFVGARDRAVCTNGLQTR